MSIFQQQAKNKISKLNKKIKILFTEGWNSEIQNAAFHLHNENIIEPILLLRNSSEIDEKFKDIKHISISDMSNTQLEEYTKFLFELRKDKGLTLEDAKKLVLEPNYLSTILLKKDSVDGVVCGIEYTTRDTLRPALQIIKKSPKSSIVTSAMMMERDDEQMILGDCSLVINPTKDELYSITKELTIFASETLDYKNINVAMLSYSTLGSGSGESVDLVKQAHELVQKDSKIIDIKANVFGEIQFDAAFVESVWNKKVPNKKWSKPLVYVFPNLNAGNIGYKIMERCGKFLAIGPIILGLDKPMNDLSRGASKESVIEIAYITASQVK